MKYRKKPVVIEAYQTDKEMDIETLEGTMHASVGDYIITGVRGEQYPCKPDIFEQTYEPEDAPTASPWRRVEEPPEEEGRYWFAVRFDGHWIFDAAWYTHDISTVIEVPCCEQVGGFYKGNTEVHPDYWMPIEPPKEDA